jgi:putative two-component system response regulator
MEASNGADALDIIEKHTEDLSVVLLDLVMPKVDGFEVLNQMNRSGVIKNIPVILITSEDDDEMALRAYALGVSDFVKKPFNSEIVNRRVHNVIDLYSYKNHLEDKLDEQRNELIEQEGRIKEMNYSLIDTLSATVEFRNVESGKHIRRIRMLLKLMLQDMRKDYSFTDEEIDLISVASALHDVGKIAIPDSVLLKPSKLSDEEFEVMKGHTVKGCEILESLDYFHDREYYQYCYDICRHHHEKWDGKGYPDGIAGDDIPIWAQVTSIIDAYDALTSKRVYKDAYDHDTAIKMIINEECGQFNPKLLDSLDRIKDDLKAMADSIAEGNKEFPL